MNQLKQSVTNQTKTPQKVIKNVKNLGTGKLYDPEKRLLSHL